MGILCDYLAVDPRIFSKSLKFISAAVHPVTPHSNLLLCRCPENGNDRKKPDRDLGALPGVDPIFIRFILSGRLDVKERENIKAFFQKLWPNETNLRRLTFAIDVWNG